jgi:hypothetical protein
MKATRQLVSHHNHTTPLLYLIHSTIVSSSGGSGSGTGFLYHPFFATGDNKLVTPSLTS